MDQDIIKRSKTSIFEDTQCYIVYILNLVYLYQAIIENPHILSVNYRNVLKHIKSIPLPVKKCLISLLDGEIVTPAQLDKYIEEVFE